jgi:hypothetical protein
MAFTVDTLKRITIGPSLGTGRNSVKSLWMYVTNDTAAAVETTGYFNANVANFSAGDQISASLDMDGTPEGRIYLVTAVTATAVTVAPFKATAIA